MFKPKTAKSATPTPVLIVSLESTEYSSSAIGKLLNLKELRLASEDLIKETFVGAQTKDDVSLFSLPSPASATLHIVLDKALAESTAKHPFRVSSGDQTVFLSGQEIRAYLAGLKGGEEGEKGLRVVDFAEIKAQAGEDGKKEEKKPAAPIA